MWATTLFHHPMPLLQWGAVLCASLVAAVSDARHRRIPNLLTFPLLLVGLASSLAFGGTPGLLDGFAACLLLAFPYVLLFVFAGGGAGDAKLMGALGAWLGLLSGTVVLFAVALSGTAFALAHAHRRHASVAALVSVGGLTRGVATSVLSGGPLSDLPALLKPAEDAERIPYGLAILAGVTLSAGGVLAWHFA